MPQSASHVELHWGIETKCSLTMHAGVDVGAIGGGATVGAVACAVIVACVCAVAVALACAVIVACACAVTVALACAVIDASAWTVAVALACAVIVACAWAVLDAIATAVAVALACSCWLMTKNPAIKTQPNKTAIPANSKT